MTQSIVEQPESKPVVRLDVVCQQDGGLVITADSFTAARLAGRHQFGGVAEVQSLLVDRIADAWYEAGCPREKTS